MIAYAVRYAGFPLRDSSQSTRKTLPPKKLMESSNPGIGKSSNYVSLVFYYVSEIK